MAGRPRKLTPEDHARIVEMRAREGLTLATIAKQFSVGIATVSRICSSAPDGGSDPGPNSGAARSTQRTATADPSGTARDNRLSGQARGGTDVQPAAGEEASASPTRHRKGKSRTASAASGSQDALEIASSGKSPGKGTSTDQPAAKRGAAPAGQRPVLSLWRQEQEESTNRAAHHRDGDGAGNADRSQAANRKVAAKQDGAPCPTIDIQDKSVAVASALERWRRTRAQEDYAEVDKALANIRKALARAEVELWTWQ